MPDLFHLRHVLRHICFHTMPQMFPSLWMSSIPLFTHLIFPLSSIIYLSVYLSVCRYISCFQDLILVSCSTINIGMHLLLKYDIFQLSWEDTQKRYIESSEIWNSIFWGISVPISKVFVWVYINSVWKYPYYFILANIWDYDSFLKNAHENFYKMCSLML